MRCITNTTSCRSNEAPAKTERQINMKTFNPVIVVGSVALVTMAINVSAGNVYLSPRAAGNQIKLYAGAYDDSTPVKPTAITQSPRAALNQANRYAGTNNDSNPALACVKTMDASPKAVTECISHTTMPGCRAPEVASLK